MHLIQKDLSFLSFQMRCKLLFTAYFSGKMTNKTTLNQKHQQIILPVEWTLVRSRQVVSKRTKVRSTGVTSLLVPL